MGVGLELPAQLSQRATAAEEQEACIGLRLLSLLLDLQCAGILTGAVTRTDMLPTVSSREVSGEPPGSRNRFEFPGGALSSESCQ